MASQDLLFPFLPKTGPVITPGVDFVHINKLRKSERLKEKNKATPENNKYDNIQRHLGKKDRRKQTPDDEHQIDLFV